MIVECIKSVSVFDKTIIAKGNIIDTTEYSIGDGRSHSPIIVNFNNEEYFKPFERKYKDGDAVCYVNLKKYFGIIRGYDIKQKRYLLHLENGTDTTASELHLAPSKVYYFINTEGMVHSTYQCKNWNRDEYCQLTGNMYDTKELADKALSDLRNK